jgi:hypothetical protein
VTLYGPVFAGMSFRSCCSRACNPLDHGELLPSIFGAVTRWPRPAPPGFAARSSLLSGAGGVTASSEPCQS